MHIKTHVTWDRSLNNKCPDCQGETLLVVALGEMRIAEGDEGTFQNAHYEETEIVEIEEEISGHYCPECHQLVSLSLNAFG